MTQTPQRCALGQKSGFFCVQFLYLKCIRLITRMRQYKMYSADMEVPLPPYRDNSQGNCLVPEWLQERKFQAMCEPNT